MIHKFKLLILLLVASIGSLIVFSAPSAHAQGETWQLTSKTTIVVKGGLFNGNNGNPSSLTLTVINPNVDPVIWVSSQTFDLKDSKGLSLEGRSRQAGDFCITTLNTPSLIDTRTTVDFRPIARGDCAKGGQAQIVNPGANGSGTYCQSGTTTWGCNAIWNTSAASFVTPTSKVTYAIPGAALKCGDPGFVGPCQQPINYATADCTKTDGTPGQAEQCAAIKACILDATKPQADCAKAWDDCMSTWPDKGAGYNSCKSAIAKGDFTGGKHIADATPGATSSCKVDGIGWIICPIMTSIANGVSTIFNVVKSFLVFQSYTTNQSSGLYPAWSIMRNFANVAFVIAFLIIIYSQLTGAGINNYGIKKMLPRLIIGAILVNISYWVCGIAVDLSNILGSSLNDLMLTLSKSVVSSGVNVSWEDATATILTGTAIGGVAVVSGLAAAGSFGALLWMLVPIVITALFSILIAVLVLAARQVLIIIFIVISPLAFVAYLLPNTNKWYKKWQDSFMILLLMFPIIAVIFGGAQFASAIIMSVKPLSMTMVLLALAVQVIPLAITPLIIKFSGGILGKFAGVVNNPNRGPLDAAKNWAKNKQELATKRGLANPNPNRFNVASRLGQWRNKRSLSDKANASTYDNQAQSMWMNSKGGIVAGDALARSEMKSQIDKANASTRVANSAEGRALTQALKGTETQAAIDKAAADAEFIATGDVNLQLTAKAARINADAAQTSQDALFTAISSKEGAAQINNVDSATKLAAQSASRRKLLTDLESGSATRVLQKEQTANLKDINTGYAAMAAGIDLQGVNRVRATAIATEQSANAEAIKHRIALMQDNSTADTLIDNAAKELIAANNSGDVLAARAATQILGSQTGNAGLNRLDATIAALETAGGIDSSIIEGVKVEAVAAGVKGRNVTIDTWATDKKHRTLADVAADPETAKKLNFRETSTQAPDKLNQWRIGGQLTVDQATAVMNAYDRGTLELDAEKVTIFRRAADGDRKT
jgi:hypothetical protein